MFQFLIANKVIFVVGFNKMELRNINPVAGCIATNKFNAMLAKSRFSNSVFHIGNFRDNDINTIFVDKACFSARFEFTPFLELVKFKNFMRSFNARTLM